MFPSNAHLIKPLGIHDKLKLVRKRESVEGVASPPAVVKKSYNIPICDVVEQHHDEIVKPTFELPENYIRHVRRFGDEADITVDCNMDADDKVNLFFLPVPSSFAPMSRRARTDTLSPLHALTHHALTPPRPLSDVAIQVKVCDRQGDEGSNGGCV
jgi:hypothetical protein